MMNLCFLQLDSIPADACVSYCFCQEGHPIKNCSSAIKKVPLYSLKTDTSELTVKIVLVHLLLLFIAAAYYYVHLTAFFLGQPG